MAVDWIHPLLVMQERDLRCDNFRKQLEALPAQIDAEEAEVAAEHRRVAEAEAAIRALEVRRLDLEGEIEVHEATILRYKTQQMQVKKNEEYAALEHEIDTLHSRIGGIEDQVLGILEEMDRAQVALTQLRAEVAGRVATLAAHIATLQQNKISFAVDMAGAHGELAEARAALDPLILGQYDYVKTQIKRGPYAVELDGGRCLGCHLKVSGEVESAVRRCQDLVRCDSCGRILYLV